MATVLLQIGRFLFTTLPGTILLAVVGVGFVIGSIVSFVSKPEVAAKMSLAELEKGTEPPRASYLELSGGHIVWPELRTLTVKRKKRSGEVTSESTKMYYVPLVSKDTILLMTQKGPGGLWSDKNVRAWMRVSPDELEKSLPTEAAGLKEPKPEWTLKEHTIPVDWRLLKSEDQAVRDGLSQAAVGQAADKLLIVRYNTRPPTKGAMVGGGICMIFLAVLLFVPVGLLLVRRRQPASAAPPALPVAVEAGAPPQGAPIAVAMAAEPQYWYMRGTERRGPVPLSQLRSLRESGEVAGGDLVFLVGGKDWVRADTI